MALDLLSDASTSPEGSRARVQDLSLPSGMRDLLPEENWERRLVATAVLASVQAHGYLRVEPPLFEFADVLERGTGVLDPADVLRFVEPESGRVAALRPDMTPQIARMIATRLVERPPPYRLAYEGPVMRRRRGRAHGERQLSQVGVELAGSAGPGGDLELLVVASLALTRAGLPNFTLDLGDSGIVRALLEGAPVEVARAVTRALSRKDEEAVLAAARLGSLEHADILAALPLLHGGEEALEGGRRLLRGSVAMFAFTRLEGLHAAVRDRGIADQVTVDLGDVRGFSYYTGAIFHAYASGPGGAVASGGRYDELLARFGCPMPAAGFAIDLDALISARRAARASLPAPVRVLVVGAPEDARVGVLRRADVPCVAWSGDGAMAYARAWGFTHVVDGASVVDMRTGVAAASPFARGDGEAAAFFI